MYTSYAPTAPTHILQQLKDKRKLGKYHLLLAHDVIDNPKEYADLFGKGKFEIILDNGAYELGEPMPAEDLHEAAMIVRANYVALPDKLRDPVETVILATKGAKEFRRLAGSLNRRRLPYQLMAIPQGDTWDEFTTCARALQGLYDVGAWGVPRVVGDEHGTRESAVKWLQALGWEREIHLLGFSNDFRDDIVCSRMKGVRGIDSTEPIRLGLVGKQVSLIDPPKTRKRGNFWTDKVDITDQVITNIRIMDTLLNGNVKLADLQRPVK